MSWWVVPEGTIGDIINSLSSGYTNKKIAHVVQDSVKPANAVAGPFADAAKAQTIADSYNGHAPGYKGPGQQVAGGLNAVGNPLSGIQNVGDFFHRLTESETWVRVGEVGLGAILLYAGIKALSSGTVAAKASKSAVKPVRKVTRTVSKATPAGRALSTGRRIRK